MKLIEPKFEILEQAPGMDGLLKQIELCGRTCYKSHDKTAEDSAGKFVERMKSLGHGSVLEHGTVYLAMPMESVLPISANMWYRYVGNKYSKGGIVCEVNGDKRVASATNYRVLLQGDYKTWDEAVKNNFDRNWLSDLQYQCEPTEFHEKRITVRFTTDIGISREFNRHRVNSPSEQSTRYCNYSKDKFGGEISVVSPIRAREQAEKTLRDCRKHYGDDLKTLAALCYDVSRLAEEGEYDGSKEAFTDIDTWLFANLATQWSYMRLAYIFGWPAEDARSVLPLDTATELVHTAFVKDWENFFKLRCDCHAHPMARELAIPLREEFVKRGLIKE